MPPYLHVQVHMWCYLYCTGIMLLEKQLLINVEDDVTAKRARTTSAAPSDLATTTWVEMSRCSIVCAGDI